MKKDLSIEVVVSKIVMVRGKRVMLDKDIALFYGVKAIVLRQQVKRNSERFPDDFMFQLTKAEVEVLVSQNVIPSKRSLGGYLPYAFTEQGVAMLSGVLRSKQAVAVNIQIMRAFTVFRKAIMSNCVLRRKIEALEKCYAAHDEKINRIFEIIKSLIQPTIKEERKIKGFSER